MEKRCCFGGVGGWTVVNLVVLVLVLSGCGNSYSLNINKLNLDAKQKGGVIQFSDPKLFPREYLINERRDDLAFLASALKACNDVKFEPQIIRELEVVQMLAVGVGLKVDPAAARNFEGSADIAELKNDIAKTRLEMELVQLRRDAELLKERLDDQESSVNQPDQNTGSPPSSTVPSGVSALTVAEVNKLLEKVDKVVNDLQADARTNIAGLIKKGGSTGPIDTFNHRKACRDTVKNVINQTRLDDLHAMDGNALVRVQVRATVLPGEDGYDDTFGILRMEVEPPEFDEKDSTAQVYRSWLEYVNQNINIPPEAVDQWKDRRIRTASRFSILQKYFQLRYLELPKIGLDGGPLNEKSENCSGLQTEESKPKDCWYLRIALPFDSADHLDVMIQAPDHLIDQLLGAAKGIRSWDKEANGGIAAGPFNEECEVKLLDNQIDLKRLNHTSRPGKTAQEALKIAILVKAYWPNLLAVSASLSDSFESKPHGHEIRTSVQHVIGDSGFALVNAANEVLDAIGTEFPKCKRHSFEGLSAPTEFNQAIQVSAQRVAVYDVAPAEKVQVVSTAARAAEALALAVSVVGSRVTSSVGSSGNLGFLRSVVGKADAIELAPIVVGFTEPVHIRNDGNKPETNSSFGWLFGPKAVIDPKRKELTFVHPVKPHELYADLSLPGWWPWFRLKTYTAWAPNWRPATDSAATLDISGETVARTVKVPMRHNAGDMDGLTTMLLKAASMPVLGAPRIVRIEPSVVSPCDGRIDFQIWGDNVWRTSMVHLGGRTIDKEQNFDDSSTTTTIKVLPDMRGIVASVDMSKIPIRRGPGGTLTVWTPDGRDTVEISFYDELEKDNTCRTKALAAPRVEPGAPSISVLRPGRVSACAGTVKFQLLGGNLTTNPQINVGGIAATGVSVLPSKNGLSFDLNVADIPAIENKIATVSVSTEGGDTLATLAFFDRRKTDGSCVTAQTLSKPIITGIVPDQISVCTTKVLLTAQGANLGAPVEARFGGIMASTVEELPPMNGTLARFEVDLKASRNDFVGMVDATAEIRTPHGLAFINVVLMGKPSDCEQQSQSVK